MLSSLSAHMLKFSLWHDTVRCLLYPCAKWCCMMLHLAAVYGLIYGDSIIPPGKGFPHFFMLHA